jgi:hypothetical protein
MIDLVDCYRAPILQGLIITREVIAYLQFYDTLFSSLLDFIPYN